MRARGTHVVRKAWAILAVILILLTSPPRPAWAQEDAQQTALKRKLLDIATCRNPRPLPVEPDATSAVAAGRYFVLLPRIPDGLRMHAGMLEAGVEKFAVIAAADFSAEDYAKELEANQAWIEEFQAAAELSRGDIRFSGSFRDGALDPTDPREGMLGRLRAADRILRDDAVRLWIKGERAKSLRRLAACLGVVRHLREERFNEVMGLVAANEVNKVAELVLQMKAAAGADGLPECVQLVDGVTTMDPRDPTRVRALYFDGSRDRLAYVEACTKGDRVSICLVTVLGEAKASVEVFSRLFEAFAGKEVGEPDRRSLVERLADDLSDLTVEEVRARAAQAREELKRIEREWDKAEPDLEVKEDEGDKARIVWYVVGIPKVVRKEWAERVAQVKKLREALGIEPAAPAR